MAENDQATTQGTGSCKAKYCQCEGFHEGKITGYCDSSNGNGGTCGHHKDNHR